jgi:CCDC81-like prokaryotic HU domain 2
MEDSITSYLIQKKNCHLPLLGNFIIRPVPASLDIANKAISPSTDEIIFNDKGDYLSEELKNYISHLDKIPMHVAEEKINNWCLHAKVKLDSGEKIVFNSVGALQKNGLGNIVFQREKDLNFYELVIAERVIHKNAEHAVLVGDKETTSVVMNEFYRDEALTQKKSLWKIWAVVLLVISLLVLLFYFSNNSLSETGIANKSAFPVQQPSSAYSTLK